MNQKHRTMKTETIQRLKGNLKHWEKKGFDMDATCPEGQSIPITGNEAKLFISALEAQEKPKDEILSCIQDSLFSAGFNIFNAEKIADNVYQSLIECKILNTDK